MNSRDWRVRALTFLAGIFYLSAATADETREIKWKDLLPSQPIQFEDPFASLSKEQLRALGMIARFRNLLERDAIDPEGESARQAAELGNKLEAEGIDVDWIISQRGRVIQQRKERAEQVEAGMDGKRIRIPGYVLPLREDQNRITEFLLVPWVGACIHTPPPPPNQMIHVSMPEGTKNRGRFVPVWIEGVILLKPSEYELFLVDGSGVVNVAYTMTAIRVSDYSAKESNVLAEVEAPEFGNEHSWFQNLQTKVSIMFTKTMTAIRDRESSGPLWTGLLIAFLYGLVHTLGPGHGKAVVISYFAGEGGSLARGVAMGTRIAVFHVLSAIIVVWVMDFAVRQTTGSAPSDYRMVKLVSYASIALIGAWMLWQALRNGKHSHDDPHHHEGCCACAAAQKNNRGMGGWLALAVGSVPCTGALLVLLFGMANDLLGPAIFLVISISAGMAVAMSGIGVLALLGRRAADRHLNQEKGERFARRARIIGAAAVLVIGCGLFALTF